MFSVQHSSIVLTDPPDTFGKPLNRVSSKPCKRGIVLIVTLLSAPGLSSSEAGWLLFVQAHDTNTVGVNSTKGKLHQNFSPRNYSGIAAKTTLTWFCGIITNPFAFPFRPDHFMHSKDSFWSQWYCLFPLSAASLTIWPSKQTMYIVAPLWNSLLLYFASVRSSRSHNVVRHFSKKFNRALNLLLSGSDP